MAILDVTNAQALDITAKDGNTYIDLANARYGLSVNKQTLQIDSLDSHIAYN